MASLRIASWVEHLSKNGYHVTICTTSKSDSDGPLTLRRSFPGGHLIEYRGVFGSVAGWCYGNFCRKLARRLHLLEWVLVQPLLLRLNRTSFDKVITSYGPWQTHIFGYYLKKLGCSPKWIADYRDSWSANPIRRRTNLHDKIVHKLEAYCLKHVNAITTVSDGLASDLRQKFPKLPIKVIYNGYEGAPELSQHAEQFNACIRIVHTGTIYPRCRDPSALFQALKNLQRPQAALRIEVQFYGDRTAGVADIASHHGVSSLISFKGHVSHLESLNAQKNADLLLLLSNSDKFGKGVLTAKIFEYLIAGVPVIGVGFTGKDEIGQILQRAGVGRALGNDISEIQAVITSLLLNQTPSWYSPNQDFIETFSRECQALMLVDFLHTIK